MINLRNSLNQPQNRALFTTFYGDNETEISKQINRYENIIANYTKLFGDGDIQLFSTPGRTEIGGNHTDHNHGRVLAGSVNLDNRIS